MSGVRCPVPGIGLVVCVVLAFSGEISFLVVIYVECATRCPLTSVVPCMFISGSMCVLSSALVLLRIHYGLHLYNFFALLLVPQGSANPLVICIPVIKFCAILSTYHKISDGKT